MYYLQFLPSIYLEIVTSRMQVIKPSRLPSVQSVVRYFPPCFLVTTNVTVERFMTGFHNIIGSLGQDLLDFSFGSVSSCVFGVHVSQQETCIYLRALGLHASTNQPKICMQQAADPMPRAVGPRPVCSRRRALGLYGAGGGR